MRNKIFSRGLYTETLRRIKIPSVIALAIVLLNAVSIPITSMISLSNEENAYAVQGYDALPELYIVFAVAAPLLTWLALSFLKSRNASDCYHSLPHTRLCIYTSIISAIISVLFGIILLSGGLCALLIEVLPCKMSLIPGSMLKFMLGCLASSLLMVGGVSIGMTVTGRPFSSIVVSGLILFLPRFFISVVIFAVKSRLPIVSGDILGILSFDNANIVYYTFFGFFGIAADGYSETVLPVTMASAQIYTATLGIIYIVFAALLFRKRKSETAEKSAPGKILQALYRISVTMVMCVFVCALIFTEECDISAIVILYAVAVIIYFSYELITTKTFKGLYKTIPSLLIVVLLNFAVIGTMNFLYNNELNFAPAVDEIDSVSVVMTSDTYYDIAEYVKKEYSTKEMTDEKVLTAVCEALKNNVDVLKRCGSSYEYNINYTSSETDYTSLDVKIKSGATSKTRSLYFTDEQYNELTECAFGMTESENVSVLSEVLSSADEDNIYIGYDTVIYGYDYGNVDLGVILNAMKDDVKNISDSEFIEKYNRSEYSGQYEVTLNVIDDGNSYTVYVFLFPELFPTAVEKLNEMLQR